MPQRITMGASKDISSASQVTSRSSLRESASPMFDMLERASQPACYSR